MKYFMFKLIPPRPTFNVDMNEQEQATMQLHMQYWADLFAKKKAIVYGPVLDPKGVFGMAVMEVETDEEANEIALNDPSVTSKLNTYELIPMMVGLVRQ